MEAAKLQLFTNLFTPKDLIKLKVL